MYSRPATPADDQFRSAAGTPENHEPAAAVRLSRDELKKLLRKNKTGIDDGPICEAIDREIRYAVEFGISADDEYKSMIKAALTQMERTYPGITDAYHEIDRRTLSQTYITEDDVMLFHFTTLVALISRLPNPGTSCVIRLVQPMRIRMSKERSAARESAARESMARESVARESEAQTRFSTGSNASLREVAGAVVEGVNALKPWDQQAKERGWSPQTIQRIKLLPPQPPSLKIEKELADWANKEVNITPQDLIEVSVLYPILRAALNGDSGTAARVAHDRLAQINARVRGKLGGGTDIDVTIARILESYGCEDAVVDRKYVTTNDAPPAYLVQANVADQNKGRVSFGPAIVDGVTLKKYVAPPLALPAATNDAGGAGTYVRCAELVGAANYAGRLCARLIDGWHSCAILTTEAKRLRIRFDVYDKDGEEATAAPQWFTEEQIARSIFEVRNWERFEAPPHDTNTISHMFEVFDEVEAAEAPHSGGPAAIPESEGKRGSFISTTTVDRLAAEIEKEAQGRNIAVTIIGPTTAAALMSNKDDQERWPRIKAKWAGKVKGKAVAAVLLHAQHFITVSADPTTRQMKIMDSKSSYNVKSKKKITDRFARMIRELWSDPAPLKIQEVEAEQQWENDCAIHAVNNLALLVVGNRGTLTRDDLASAAADPTYELRPIAKSELPAQKNDGKCTAKSTGQGKQTRCKHEATEGSLLCHVHRYPALQHLGRCEQITAKGEQCKCMAGLVKDGKKWCGAHLQQQAAVGHAKSAAQERKAKPPPPSFEEAVGREPGEEIATEEERRTTDFRIGGVQVPHAAVLTRHQLTTFAKATMNCGPSFAQKGLAIETRQAHVAVLKALARAAASTGWSDLSAEHPAADFAVRWIDYMRKVKRWKWSTVRTKMACLAGACDQLPMYVPGTRFGYKLHEVAVWRSAARHADIKAAAEIPDQAPPATMQQVWEACEQARPEVAAMLALMWVTAARPGCVTQLSPQDVVMSGDQLTVTFRRGKSVQLRKQPYAVHTTLGRFAKFIKPQLQRAAKSEAKFVWPAEARQDRSKMINEMLQELQAVERTLTTKSLRRGALQLMAKNGVPAQTLMLFSGHSTLQMLKRYLGFGLDLIDEATRTRQQAAQVLAGSTPSSTSGGRHLPRGSNSESKRQQRESSASTTKKSEQ